MKARLLKWAKGLAKEVMEDQIKKMQSPEFEMMVAEKMAEMMPDYKGWDDEKQKEIALVCVDCCTDLLATSMDMDAD